LMQALKKTIDMAVGEFHPDIIHAASPVLVGLPALYIARKHKLPFVYEVRDLWENASVDRGKWTYDSAPYKAARKLETIIFRRADAVVTICEALRDEIAPRVGKNASPSVIANGVESSLFHLQPPDQRVLEQWGLAGKRVLAYIGAFQPYEGLETLILAMPEIAQKIPEAHLVIAGGGGELEPELHALVSTHCLEKRVTFTGRVPHDQVQSLYSVVDLMVYPRISTRTTQLTTPLKPLEAMAQEVPVVVSDTKAMLELVQPGTTGLCFHAGDVADLARVCVMALRDEQLLKQMAKNARLYVETKRHWPNIVEGYQDIYTGAITKNQSRL